MVNQQNINQTATIKVCMEDNRVAKDLKERLLTLTASRREPMTIDAVGTGGPVWSRISELSASAHMFTICSVGPSSRAMVRPWKPGFS